MRFFIAEVNVSFLPVFYPLNVTFTFAIYGTNTQSISHALSDNRDFERKGDKKHGKKAL